MVAIPLSNETQLLAAEVSHVHKYETQLLAASMLQILAGGSHGCAGVIFNDREHMYFVHCGHFYVN